MDRALQLARDLEHPYSIAYALHHAAVLDLWRGDPASVTAHADESLDLATTHDYPIWQALALVLGGAAAVSTTDAPDPGLAQIERGFTLYEELSTPPVFWAHLLMIRASAYAAAGQVHRALALLEVAESSVESHDPVEANIAIAHGDVLLLLPSRDPVEVEALFERAAAHASARRARMVELEALTRLATLHRTGVKGDDARRRLRSVVDAFTEGFDTLQMTAAKSALGDG
jgi:hypothetical protein